MSFLKINLLYILKLIWYWSLKCYLICDIRFYYRYYRLLDANIAGNKLARLLLNLFQLIIIVQTIHITLSTLFRNQLSETDNVLYGSLLYFEHASLNSNQTLWIEAFNLLALLLLRIIYYQHTGITNQLMRATLLELDQSFWIYPQIKRNVGKNKSSKWLFRLLEACHSFVELPTSQTKLVRLAAVFILNTFHSIHYFAVLYAATVQYRSYFLLRDAGLFDCTPQNTINLGWLKYSVFQLKFAFYAIYSLVFLHVFITVGTFALLTAWIAWVRLHQMNRYVASFAPEVFTGERVTRCRRLSAEYLVQLADANRIFGRILFMFLLLAAPSNSHMIMMVLLTRAEQDRSSALIFKSSTMIVAADQLVVIFGVHWAAAKMALLLHRPVRHLMKVTHFSRRFQSSLQMRLSLAHYIEAFHTVNRYCVTYGQYGAITFSSYGKVVYLGNLIVC